MQLVINVLIIILLIMLWPLVLAAVGIYGALFLVGIALILPIVFIWARGFKR